MSPKASSTRTECLNPNSGRSMQIETSTYELFSKAIFHVLKERQPLSYSELEKGVRDFFQKNRTRFTGSVGWYAVTVKNDMEARGMIECFLEKGKKMHRLKGKAK